MTVECCSQVCGRQGFCWVEPHSDKRAWQSQDYSVCWEDWNIMSSEIYCMFSPDLFVSAPPAAVHAPCFQVSQNGKHLAWKTLWYLNISLIQFQAFSTDLMKSPFWVFFMFFFFFSTSWQQNTSEKETLRGRAIPSNTIPSCMEVISSLVILYASTVTTGLKLYSVSKWRLFCGQGL